IGVPTASILRIEKGRSPLEEYEDRASRIAPGDADAWAALGDWAAYKALSAQAREAYQRALSASPNHPRANEALGNVQLGGRWGSEEEGCAARGYVRFEGNWMTPAEQQAILQERTASAQQAHERQQAELQAREAEARAQEAEARAREAEAQAQSSDELWWGW